ncbi:asparaginase [Ramaria rubella]|nr:asparaginase [Ramaria rubella]
MTFYVAVHGGAGFHPPESEKDVKKALRSACLKALTSLQSGKKACEAVEDAIVSLEDSECLNAGYGSNLTQSGTVECDASLMEDSGNFGSVGAVSGVKNPIRAAKAVLDYSQNQSSLGRIPPLLLVSSGAREFASVSGIETVHPDLMISPRAQNEWISWSDRAKGGTASDIHHNNMKLGSSDTVIQDTVGSVVLDASGSLAAGVSSGGILLKLPGRVGEGAVFSAGCWADNLHAGKGVACSVSGTGEAIMRVSLARALAEAFREDDPHEELHRILADEFSQVCVGPKDLTPSAGALIINKETREDGTIFLLMRHIARLWCVFNTASMAIAYASSDNPHPKVYNICLTHRGS